jgi:hypothetical protein
MYWSIHGGIAVKLTQVAPAEIASLRTKHGHDMAAIPVYWAEETGVWPKPMAGCVVVMEVDPEKLKGSWIC